MNDTKIFWIDLNRFDIKVNKSPWIEIAEVIIKNGFKVTLMCGYEQEKYNPPGYRINIEYCKSIQYGGLFRYSLLFCIILWLLKNAHADDIIIVRPGSLIAGFVLKCLRGCHIHMDVRTVPVEVHSLRDKIDKLLFWNLPLKFFKKIPDSYSFITKLLKKSMEVELGTGFNDYVIWQSGVNVQFFQAHHQIERQRDRGKFVLFYHGTITPNRGLDLVIGGLAKIKSQFKRQIVFMIIGNGYDVKRLRKMALEYGIYRDVHFEEYVPYEKIPFIINEADCCICPLPDREEWNVSSPIKVFEYLACAKPVILTPIKAHRQIVGDEDFIIWTDGYDTEDFAKAIEYACKNIETLRVKARKAPQFVQENYDWEIQGSKFAKYLKGKLRC